METMDHGKKLISVFATREEQPELIQAMRDVASLSGVLKELGEQEFFQKPLQVLRVLKILQMINEEALGLNSAIDDERTLFYRYGNTYGEDPLVTLEWINHLVYILVKYNWIAKTSNRIRMMSLGKRLMDALIRLANDSLAYYLNDEVARSLFQAKRDAELSEAYDDKGISGGNKLASMIRNVEEAVDLLKERELEYLADRNALEQVQIIHGLMNELDMKMKERIATFETLEEGIPLADLIQKGTLVMTEGTKMSLGTINKILKFSHLKNTDMSHAIQNDRFRVFVVKTFDNPFDSELPNPHQLLSFMEQDQYEGERMDGLWIPVKFASPIGAQDVDGGIDYIENYKPVVVEIEEELDQEFIEPEELNEQEIQKRMEDSQWQMTKEKIEMEHLESYLAKVKEASLEEVILEVGSTKWGGALNTLMGLSAMISNRRARVEGEVNESIVLPERDKEWEWMEDGQGRKRVRRISSGK